MQPLPPRGKHDPGAPFVRLNAAPLFARLNAALSRPAPAFALASDRQVPGFELT